MNRLTDKYRNLCISCELSIDDECDLLNQGKFCANAKRYHRLAQIEDILGDKYDLGRLRELVEADKDGRCRIPPVKLHQTIYRVFDGKILEETVCKAIWEPFVPRPRWKVWVMGSGNPYYWNDCIGKTVFLTREAAESALKGDQDAAEV